MLRKIVLAIAATWLSAVQPVLPADAVSVDADFKAFRDYFTKRFPNVPLNDFVNGPYSMDVELRKQWEAKEEFPPYEFALEQGKDMFATPFKNGKSYADCFPNQGIGIRQDYPYFDEKAGKVITLELALNLCRGQRRTALLLSQGRDGGTHRLHGLHLTPQAVQYQGSQRPACARCVREWHEVFLPAPWPAQFLLCELSRAKPRPAHPH